ncbi:hypothetical protein CYY_004485 [Polysphondylium violaceum]|uniref:Uncharacterized protein n=1 Tax=Polysphondylium violaceum TaxID=133409 RepID=A0A8J4PY55_9MYCE|nr:hypothetical protein CYY_004485 [Polysphondylium violaceum]
MSNNDINLLLSLKSPVTGPNNGVSLPPLNLTEMSDSQSHQIPISDDEEGEYYYFQPKYVAPSIPFTGRVCDEPACIMCQRGTPIIIKNNPTWSTIMRVVFFTLAKIGPDSTFFNLRNDVYSWMEDHWEILCDGSKDKDANWRKQVQDMLSHSKNLFESGALEYKQNGFWRLKTLGRQCDPWTILKAEREKSKIPTNKSRTASIKAKKTPSTAPKNALKANFKTKSKEMLETAVPFRNIHGTPYDQKLKIITSTSESILKTLLKSPLVWSNAVNLFFDEQSKEYQDLLAQFGGLSSNTRSSKSSTDSNQDKIDINSLLSNPSLD